MGIGLKRTLGTGSRPVFQGDRHDIQLLQGGAKLDITGLVVGSIIPEGTPFTYSEATRLAKPLPTAVIYENAASNAVNYKIKKDSQLKVGDYFAGVPGAAAYAITAIDKTNAAYDVVTVGTTIGALSANDFVFASSATGASSAAFPADLVPASSGLLYEEVKVEEGESVSIAIKATVYARRCPYSPALATAMGSRIIYSQSY